MPSSTKPTCWYSTDSTTKLLLFTNTIFLSEHWQIARVYDFSDYWRQHHAHSRERNVSVGASWRSTNGPTVRPSTGWGDKKKIKEERSIRGYYYRITEPKLLRRGVGRPKNYFRWFSHPFYGVSVWCFCVRVCVSLPLIWSMSSIGLLKSLA